MIKENRYEQINNIAALKL